MKKTSIGSRDPPPLHTAPPRAPVERRHAVASPPPDPAPASGLAADDLVAAKHELARLLVDRHGELAVRRAAALDLGLVVAGEQPGAVAELGDAHRAEIFLEEAPRG